MRISPVVTFASLVGATAPPSDTIVCIESGDGDVDVRRLPQMLRKAGHTPDEKVASFLGTAEITTLEFVHLQVVKTSASTIDSDTLCNFVTTTCSNLSLRAECSGDANGEAFGGRSQPKTQSQKPVHYDSDLHVNDADAGYQEHLKWMRMGEVWRLALPHVKRKITVAVTDSGIDWKDPDFALLKGKLKKQSGGYLEGGWNFVTNSPILTNKDSHGTKVCKILAAKGNNSFGIAGMAPNVTLVPLQVFGDTPGETLSRYVEALDLAIDVKVDMLSMSVGWELSDLEHAQRNVLMRALYAVHRSGIFMVSSAGNQFSEVHDMYPCCFGGPTSMCVAYMYSNRTHNVLNPITNWGIRVDVAAYGNNIFTGRDEKGELRYFNGTSAAQPLVAGLIAILLSMDVDPRMAKSMVMANVDHVDCALPEDLPQSIRGGAINPLRTIKYAIEWLSSRSRGLRAAKRVGLLD